MSKQSQWLFETPSVQASKYYANPEYETPLEQEWEMSGGNNFNFPLTEDEWEVSPTRRPIRRAARIPQRRPAMPRRQQGRAPVAQRQLRQPAPSPQGQGTGGDRTLIATIDGFEFGSYLLKKRQFDRLDDLVTVLKFKHEQDKEFLPKLKLEFIGHTDNVGGNSKSNLHLGARRAMEVESFVKQFFKKKAPNLPTTVNSKSSTEPVTPNSNRTPKGRELNRRVQVFSNIRI